MKKTQFNAVLELFKRGEILNINNTPRLTGCTALRSRVSDYIKLGYVFHKKKATGKTRYKTKCQYINYSLDFKKTPKKLLK